MAQEAVKARAFQDQLDRSSSSAETTPPPLHQRTKKPNRHTPPTDTVIQLGSTPTTSRDPR